MLDVEQLNAQLPGSLKLALVAPDECELLEKNARYMTSEMFQNLITNIKKDGGLSSVPFAWKHEARPDCPKNRHRPYRVLSGNHRIQAAIQAEISQILIMFTDQPLSRQELVAKQLSHNSIAGQDDLVVLNDLWKEIDDLALKAYAGLDDKLLGMMESVNLDGLSEARLDFRTTTFVFLPEEVKRMDEIFTRAIDSAPAENVYVARLAEWDKLLNTLAKVAKIRQVKNAATALMLILDEYEAAHKDDPEPEVDERGGGSKKPTRKPGTVMENAKRAAEVVGASQRKKAAEAAAGAAAVFRAPGDERSPIDSPANT